MYVHTGFYQDDLRIFLYGGDIVEDSMLMKEDTNQYIQKLNKRKNLNDEVYYQLFHIYEGNAIIRNGVNEFKIGKNSTVCSNMNNIFKIEMIPIKNKFKYISIDFLPIALPKPKAKDNFLRAFQKINETQNLILNDKILNELFNSLEYFIIKSYEPFYVRSTFQAIIARTCVKYDIYKNNNPTTDNIYVRIIEYIKTNYANIKTINDVEKEFFISSNTLEKIVKSYTKITFWDFVTQLRLEQANKLMKTGRFSAGKCGEMAGFDSYTTFYRNYKKFYGISPSEFKPKELKEKWPLE